MKRIKRNPFGKQITEIVPVVEQSDGRKVWFARKPITPDVDPVDVQLLQRKQSRITTLLFMAANKVAAERGIPADDARALFFPQTEKDGTETVPLNFIDYLSESQMEEFLVLQADAASLPINCATAMLQHRLVFELTITGSTDAGFVVEDPWFDIGVGDRFKFGSSILTVNAYRGDTVSFKEELQLEIGATGFLVAPDGEYVLGDPNWTEAQTRNMLSVGDDGQIAAIFRFYEDCKTPKARKTPEPQPSPTSNASLTPPALTGGETSTPNAVLSESPLKTIGSPIGNLATAQ